jgi:hypothetical protein
MKDRTLGLNAGRLVFLLLLSGCADKAFARPDACKLFDKGARPRAVLLDRENRVVRGPVDLGDMPFDANFERENYKVETGYKVLVVPRSVEVDNTVLDGEYVKLQSAPEICRDVATFAVNVFMNFNKGDARPYKMQAVFPALEISDVPQAPSKQLKSPYGFDARVIGTIVQPSK